MKAEKAERGTTKGVTMGCKKGAKAPEAFSKNWRSFSDSRECCVGERFCCQNVAGAQSNIQDGRSERWGAGMTTV